MPNIYSALEMIDIAYRNGDGTFTGNPVTSPWVPLGSYTRLNPSDYDGSCTFEFEIVVNNTSYETVASNFRLRNITTGTVMTTIAVPANGVAGIYSLYYVAFAPTAGMNVYAVELPAPENDYVNYYGQGLISARICITQTNATKFVQSIPLTAAYGTNRYYANADHYLGHTTSTDYNFGSRTNATKTYMAWQGNNNYTNLIKAELQAAAFGNGTIALMDYTPANFETFFSQQEYVAQTPVAYLDFTEASTTLKSVDITAGLMDYSKAVISPIKASSGQHFYLDKARLNLYYQNLTNDVISARVASSTYTATIQFARIPWAGSVILQMAGSLANTPYNLSVVNHGDTYTNIIVNAVNACGSATINSPNTEVTGARTALVSSNYGNVYQSSPFTITSGNLYALAPVECPLPAGVSYSIFSYCYSNLMMLNAPDTYVPPPPTPSDESITGGIYYISPDKTARHDSYYNNIERRIPAPTVRTAFIGE